MTYTEEEKYWIWLASVKEIGPKTFYHILREFKSAASFFGAAGDAATLTSLPAKARAAVQAARSRECVAETVCALESAGIRAVTRLSEEYPALLVQIDSPPPVLYVKGSLSGFGDAVAIVGTRRCTRRAAALTREIAHGLTEAGVTVVSGMALGIDAQAHRGAMDAGGQTVAVLGCGADVVYPPENLEIYDYAIKHGAVVSEYLPGEKPYYGNFPARNRIITGMCAGTLIVESEMKGGTAISAAAAIAQGRDVFAVPGSPAEPMAALPNELIAQGAVPVRTAQDILAYYGETGAKTAVTDSAPQAPQEIQLDFLQREIYNLLMQGDMSAQALASAVSYGQSEINAALTTMELSGLIERMPGGKYGTR